MLPVPIQARRGSIVETGPLVIVRRVLIGCWGLLEAVGES